MMIKIGTRGSQLALWQANYVASLLAKENIGSEIIIIETKGDKILNKSVAKIGSKGVFTAEIEEQLFEKKIDIAVHSAKDLQSSLSEGLHVIAYGEREKPHDVLVSFNKNTRLSEFDKSFVVGTSSTRRTSLLRHYHPHIRTAEARGNLQTRMKKLEEGYYDALILAYAGVARMDYAEYIVEELSLDEFVPAVGQGAVAVEAHTELDKDKYEAVRRLVNHLETEYCLKAERAFLKKMEGGCSVPIFALARLEAGKKLSVEGGIVALDGSVLLKEREENSLKHSEKAGIALADKILAQGGGELLKTIKKSL